MIGNLPPIQALMIKPLEVFGLLAGVGLQGADLIAAETREFSRAAFRANTSGLEKAFAARTMGEWVQAQSDRIRDNLNISIEEMEKLGGILIDMNKESVESVFQPAIQKAVERSQEVASDHTSAFKTYPEFHRAA